MYLQHFGLAEKPFAITPDPRYLYLGAQHADAIAHLSYGIREAGGFIQLTGEVGTGKTTTIRTLLARTPENADVALIINPRMTALELLQTICEEFGLGISNAATGDAKELTDQLNQYLLKVHATGRRAVLIIDEAQGLAPDVLEQVRLLTNLETSSQKLLQIILIGQPELRELLKREDLRQLAQRVTARFHLDPLDRTEASAYVRHRLRVAGATREIFNDAALREIYRQSGGVPRVINVIADRALLGAYSAEQHVVSPGMVRAAADEVFNRRSLPRWLAPFALAATAAVIAGAVWTLYRAGYWPGTHRTVALAAVGSAPAPVRLVPIEPAAPAVQKLTALLAAPAETLSGDAAFDSLFRQWRVDYRAGGVDGCTQAPAFGLECYSARGTLAELRAFNRPAILVLGSADGHSSEVVLRTLDEAHATLVIGSSDAVIDIADLANHWFGDYVLLWKPSRLPSRTQSLGMHGRDVQALRAHLRKLAGQATIEREDENFDADLQEQVRQFQEQHHLDSDGIAGPATLLQLDAALAAPGTPWLQTANDQPPVVASTGRG